MNVQPDLHKMTFAKDIGCNVSDEGIIKQVSQNIRRQLPQAKPHSPNDKTIALVCGGPSLAQTEKDLVNVVWSGASVVAVNGAYQWCIDHNIKPSVAVMLDAREFNSRFVETPVAGCKYLLASQCHPRAFDICRNRDVIIWHACSAGQPELDLLNEYYFKNINPITVGTTVGIRSIALMRMLGFQSFEIFGLDSCLLNGAHHAYEQKENDNDRVVSVWLKPKEREDIAERFDCTIWHAKQVEDFMALIKAHGNMFRLNVHGPGIIAAVLRIAAEIGGIDNLDIEQKEK